MSQPDQRYPVPYLPHLFRGSSVYTVAIVEHPRPPESQQAPPVTLYAYGPVDAVLKAGPEFDAHLARRKFRPLAYFKVTRGDMPVQIFKPGDAPIRTDDIDEENGR